MQVLVMNAGSLRDHAFTDPSVTTAGVLSAFAADSGNSLVIDSATPENIADVPQRFAFFLNTTNTGGLQSTTLLDRSRINMVTKKVYVAPVMPVWTFNGFTTGTGYDLEFRIINPTAYHDAQWYSVGFRVKTTDTAANIVTKLRDLINAKVGVPVVATVSGNDLILTGKTGDTTLQFAVDGSTFTKVNTTNGSVGSGTFAQVTALEKKALAYLGVGLVGDSNTPGAYLTPTTNATSGTQYTIYAISHETLFDRSTNKSARFEEIYICIASGVTGNLDGFFGKLGNTFRVV